MENDSAVLNQKSAENCPESCACTSVDTDFVPAVNVQCGDRTLKRVPITTFDKPVSLLNVSSNPLKTLEENT